MSDDQGVTQDQDTENAAGSTADAGSDGGSAQATSPADSGNGGNSSQSKIYYDVELIVQEQNPICWMACCAMVEGYGTKLSVGVGKYTGGADPSNSCIPNLAKDWDGSLSFMNKWGFDDYSVQQLAGDGASLTAADLSNILTQKGPMVLLHTCEGFPYGSGWDLSKLPADAAHAVVLTGIDPANGNVWFNNPWGNKDRSAAMDTILQHMNADTSRGTMGFWGGK